MAAKQAVTIRIRGQELRIRTDDDEGTLQRIAQYLDDTMSMVEEKTGTVDSLQLAILSALNLARELVELREGRAPGEGGPGVDLVRLESLIELAESALEGNGAAS